MLRGTAKADPTKGRAAMKNEVNRMLFVVVRRENCLLKGRLGGCVRDV